MEPAKERDATGRGSDGLNAKDNTGRAGPSVAAEVREAAAVRRSDPGRGLGSESNA